MGSKKLFPVLIIILLVTVTAVTGCGGGGSGATSAVAGGSGSGGGGNTTGIAELSWHAPTTNTDGTPLTDLAGYKIHYGTASGKYTSTFTIGKVTTYSFALPAGTYYFAVTTYDTLGSESSFSNEVTKTIM